MSKGLLEQFREHIADRPEEKLLALRTELLTKSVGGGERGPEEREAAVVFAQAIDEELARRHSTSTALLDRGGRPVELISTQEKAPSTESRGRWSAAP